MISSRRTCTAADKTRPWSRGGHKSIITIFTLQAWTGSSTNFPTRTCATRTKHTRAARCTVPATDSARQRCNPARPQHPMISSRNAADGESAREHRTHSHRIDPQALHTPYTRSPPHTQPPTAGGETSTRVGRGAQPTSRAAGARVPAAAHSSTVAVRAALKAWLLGWWWPPCWMTGAMFY